jgi:hypothetical protein
MVMRRSVARLELPRTRCHVQPRSAAAQPVGRRPAKLYGPDVATEDRAGRAPPPTRRRRIRGAVFRLLLVFFAFVWLTFGFGVIDFVSGFTSVDDRDPLSIGVLSAAYGAVAGIVLPAAFLALLHAPQRRPAAVQQIAVVGIAFALAGAIGLDPLSFISVGMVAVMLMAVRTLHPTRPSLLPERPGTGRAVLAVTAVGAVPWLLYALATAAKSRAGVPPEEMALRPQAGGWAGATVLALVVVLLALLAATRTPGWRVPLYSAALAATSFGLVSLLNPAVPGSVGRVWGSLAVAWSLALVLTAELGQHRGAGRPSTPLSRRGTRPPRATTRRE